MQPSVLPTAHLLEPAAVLPGPSRLHGEILKNTLGLNGVGRFFYGLYRLTSVRSGLMNSRQSDIGQSQSSALPHMGSQLKPCFI